jgi:hypothetical protein
MRTRCESVVGRSEGVSAKTTSARQATAPWGVGEEPRSVCQGGEVGEGHLKTFHRARVPSLFRSWPPCLRQKV